jgi:hypothetical protein
VDSPLLQALKGRDAPAALTILRSILPEPLHDGLDDLVAGVMRDDSR